MSSVTVVGCGTVVPEGDRACSSYWVESGETRLLLDCGPGALQALARLELPWGRVTDLAVTHFHADHIGALPGLFFAFRHGLPTPRRDALRVWGPAGTRELFGRLGAAFGPFVLDPGFPVLLDELAPGDSVRLRGGASLSAHKTPHTDESLAYRLRAAEGGALGYTGDTGASETLGTFMAGVDVLITECSLFDDQVGDNHLSPERVAAIARAARPRVLVLSHVYPHVRAAADPCGLVREAGYEGDVRLAEEGFCMEF